MMTCFDIAQPVAVASRFCSAPSEAHWTAVKHIFRYLAFTSTLGLVYSRHDGPIGIPSAFSDADHGGSRGDSWKSTSGFIVTLASAAIWWVSRLQKSVALSTVKAEYMALSLCAMEVIWLRAILDELRFRQLEPTLIRGNNQGSISLAKHPSAHQRTKHISLHYHFTRHHVATKELVLQWIPTRSMVADVMTKGLDGILHHHFIRAGGLVDVLREGEC